MRRSWYSVKLRLIGIFIILGATVVAEPASTNGLSYSTKQPSKSKRPDSRLRITQTTIAEAQRRLAELGYWIQGTEGRWNEASKHGLIAFQKVEGRPRTGRLTLAELQALNAASRPLPRE